MKRTKSLIAVVLILLLALASSGCSKDFIIDGYNNLLHHISKYALTDEKDLQGERTEGIDTYTGSYSAEYSGFSGTEYLFGGTGLKRENGGELTVSYELTVDSGSAVLYRTQGTETHVIADTSGKDTCSIVLSSQDNYIAIKGENFHGSLKITVV